MALKNESLGNKLTDFKNTKNSPHNITANNITAISEFINSTLAVLIIILKSLIYGYSIKIIFQTEWNFIQFLCIGFSITFIFQFIFELVHPQKN